MASRLLSRLSTNGFYLTRQMHPHALVLSQAQSFSVVARRGVVVRFQEEEQKICMAARSRLRPRCQCNPTYERGREPDQKVFREPMFPVRHADNQADTCRRIIKKGALCASRGASERYGRSATHKLIKIGSVQLTIYTLYRD